MSAKRTTEVSEPVRQASDEGTPASIDLTTYLPYLVHRLGAWMSPRRAFVLASGRTIRLREWRLLLLIAAHRRLTASEVTSLTAMDSAATTRAAHALTDAGLIKSECCSEDRRRQWLTLTEEGSAVYDEIAMRRIEYNGSLLAALSEGQRTALFTILGELQRRAESGEARPGAEN